MKNILAATLLYFASTATFAHEIDFSVVDSPFIVQSDITFEDGKKIIGPWMLQIVTAANHSPHDVHVEDLMMTCSGAQEFYNKIVNLNQNVPMHETVTMSGYFDRLPASESHIYSCTAILTWRGPHHVHHNTFEFQTQ